MARKATVDREAVLQMLREGQTSAVIAAHFGVSRQAIDLHRKKYIMAGLMAAERAPRPSPGTTPAAYNYPPRRPEPVAPDDRAPNQYSPGGPTPTLSLDQAIDLLTQALAALKRLPQIESENRRLQKNYEESVQQVAQLKEREQKRREQEERWLHAQPPGVLTYQPNPEPPTPSSNRQ